MSTDDVDERVREILADVLGLDPSDVTERTSTETVEEWDSLGHLTVVLALEEEFHVSFDDEETLAVTTFSAIGAVVRGKLGIGGPA